MPNKTRERNYHAFLVVRFGVFVLGFLLIAFGYGILVGLRYLNPLHDFDLVREGAHALIIAGFLVMVVDWFVKVHFIREVTRDFYHYLVGYDLPVEIKHQIKDLINTKIVRSRFSYSNRTWTPALRFPVSAEKNIDQRSDPGSEDEKTSIHAKVAWGLRFSEIRNIHIPSA
jgi:hypothetical protein